ncbi:major facilitator superfamily transporter [Pseudomassariella vexata]|uniref:Major facilitator superfamily transporter n=1 Tax=Pseudomassariella vexata TaxID=1141098 RepID=A0A1Y2DEP3_9PEZI|nr:major facilitator superfamily transporter [Pseudomassariella vexata]ORY57753.1 major facilitator superfamily transporter [Pseudomassariella vexata]
MVGLSSIAFAKRHERSPEERSLVRRLDIFLMTFGCISQVIKYLDQQNINNAYVSGMKEDLNLYGNELNYFTTWFNVSYCIMLIPSQVILTYVRPSYWLSGLEICWGLMTGLIALTTNAKQVYILRVFLGLCESSAWPGMMTLLMHWYTPSELAKRMGFYHSCQGIGSMMSGALQVAIINTLHGANGIAGWRWLFIINAVMTVVVGALGFFLLPDTPNNVNPRAFWFKEGHAQLAMERLERNGRAEPKKITWESAKRTFNNWVVYFLPVLYIATVLASYGYAYFGLFLKSLTNADGTPRWTTSEVNALPIAGNAIQVVFVWIWAILSDVLQTRWTLIVAQSVIGLIPAIAMSIWTSHPETTSLATAYASYYVSFLCLGTAPLIFAWLSDLLPQDPDGRTLIVGVSIATYYAVAAWSQVLVWPATEAPYYKYGWQSCIALWVLVIIMTSILRYIDWKYLLPKREAFHTRLIEASKTSETEPTAADGTTIGESSNSKMPKLTAGAPEV